MVQLETAATPLRLTSYHDIMADVKFMYYIIFSASAATAPTAAPPTAANSASSIRSGGCQATEK